MSKKNECGCGKNRSGFGLLDGLTLLLIGFKLAGVIDWSWVWVLAPWWIPWAIAVVCVLYSYSINKIVKRKRAVAAKENGLSEEEWNQFVSALESLQKLSEE